MIVEGLPKQSCAVAFVLLTAALTLTSGCRPEAGCSADAGLFEALRVDPERIRRHTEVLASDTYEGRAPGTLGEERTVRYVIARFREAGLEPSLPDGSYTQPVPLPAFRYDATLTFRGANDAVGLRQVPVVFAGYGIVAPEYRWDDYRGTDVQGALVLVLNGEPPSTNPRRFEGVKPAATRSASLNDVPRARRTVAILVIDAPDPIPGGYPALAREWAAERMTLDAPPNMPADATRPPVYGFITAPTTARLLAAADGGWIP